MGFYDAFKDALNLAQKADNVDLYRQLLDLGAQAQELQVENAKLKDEIQELKRNKINEEKIVRHKQPYITLQDDAQLLKYCGICWDSEHKLIQMRESADWNDTYIKLRCHKCGNICRPD